MLDQIRVAEAIQGKALVDRARARMSPDARGELDHLLPVSWCTLSTAFLMHEAIAREAGLDVNAWHRTIVRAGVERTLTTVWRLFTRILSVEGLVKRSAAIFEKSYDRGTFTARLGEGGVVEAVLDGWPDVPDFELDAIVAGLHAILAIAFKTGAAIAVERTAGGATFRLTVVASRDAARSA